MLRGGAISLPGSASLVLGAIFWIASRAVGRNARALEEALVVPKLDELHSWTHLLPLFVVLTGRVGCEEPLECEHAREKGVLYEQIAEQHFLKQRENGEWVRDAAVVLVHSRETSWWLEDGGATTVLVEDARSATGLPLSKVYDAFESTSKGMVRNSFDYLRGLKLLGVRHTERLLALGSSLTCVGEVSRLEGGKLVLRKPSSGQPFYITKKSLSQLKEELSALARQCKWLAIGFSGLGAFFVVKRLSKFIGVWRRIKHFKKRISDAERSSKDHVRRLQEDVGSDGGARAGYLSQTSNVCVICLEGSLQTVFTACGHSCCCLRCSSRLSKCPICRATSPVLRIYRP